MKVILYMAITGNGYIAKENDDTSWISKEEWDSYSAIVRKVGSLIIGHRTYNILTKQPEFIEFKNVKIIIVSRSNFKTLNKNHIVANTPKEALSLLKNYKKVIVAGGGMLNSSFIERNLVDEIYLDVEPLVFGKGIKLFADSDFELRLELLGSKNLNKNIVQIHYKVLK